MDISKYLNWLKLSPRYLFPLSLLSGFLLFASPQTTDIFGLTHFVTQYRPIIGIIFLLSSTLVISSWGLSGFGWLKSKLLQRAKAKNRRKRLHNLTFEKKSILSGYINNQTRTQYLDMGSGIVNELDLSGIIYRSSIVADAVDSWSYNIQPWAWEYLNQHPELVSISEEEIDNLPSVETVRRSSR
jgi:hypothetical protein